MHLFFFFGQINFLTSRFLRFFEDFINHIFLIGLKYKIVWSITEILCVNTVNSNSLFTHCLRKGKKKGVAKFATPWFWKWTSLGLNQGPPDYESVALTNWATSPSYENFFLAGAKVEHFFEICKESHPKFDKKI